MHNNWNRDMTFASSQMNMVCMAFTATSSAFAATLMVFSAQSALFTEMSWAF